MCCKKGKMLESELLSLHKCLWKLKTKAMMCELEKKIEEKLCLKFGLHAIEEKLHCLERKAEYLKEEAEEGSSCNQDKCECKNS